MRREHLICLLLAVLAAALYVPTTGYDFVNFDDDAYIIDNPHVTGGISGENLRWAFTTGYQANWHPLTWISLMLDSTLQGPGPGGYHLTNLLLHAANTALLFWVLWLMTGALWRSALVATLFAVHPLHVESVAWITERKDVLSMVWGLLALWAYAVYARSGKVGNYLLVAACFALSLLAKAMFITLPFALLLLDWWPLRRVRGHTDKAGGETWARRPRTLILEKLPLLLIAIAVAVATVVAQARYGAVTESAAVPRGLLIMNGLVSYVRYLGKMFWPTNLSILYPHPNMEGGTPWAGWQIASAVVVLAAISFLVYRWRRHHFLPVGWLWYLGTLVPMIGVLQVGTQAMADRYTYLPLIGVFIILAWGGDLLLNGPRGGPKAAAVGKPSPLAWILGVGAVLACSAVTARQIPVWRDSFALGEHAIAAGPTAPKITYNYALALSEAGRYAEAVPHYRKTLEMKPDHAKAWNNLGRTLQKLGNLDEAAGRIREAVRLDPQLTIGWINLSSVLLQAGQIDEAIAARRKAVELDPDDPVGHNVLGGMLGRAGRLQEAAAEFRRALALKPDFPEARRNLQAAEQALSESGQR